MEARSIRDYYCFYFIHCSLRIKAILQYIHKKKYIHFHTHLQLLFYNAKLMYSNNCNVIWQKT